MPQNIDPIESFRPDPDAACVCGSRIPFKFCCNNSESVQTEPKGMFLHRGFLPEGSCDKLTAYVSEKQGQSLKIKKVDDKGNIDDVKDPLRVAKQITLGDKQKIIDRWVKDIFYKYINKKFNKRVKEIEPAQLMRYSEGGFYKPHSDSEAFDIKTQAWQRMIDRDYSLLLYLNDDFEGGGVYFTHFNYTFKPKKGDLLIFPSNHLYIHEALEVTSGLRYVIVSWATVK